MEKRNWYQRIADAIREMVTIDLLIDTGGYPTIHWLIADHMLIHHTHFDRHRMLDHYVGQIKNNLEHAIFYLMTSGTKVYKVVPPGSKAIRVLTLDANYERAADQDYDRSRRRFLNAANAFKTHLRLVEHEKASSAEVLEEYVKTKLPKLIE